MMFYEVGDDFVVRGRSLSSNKENEMRLRRGKFGIPTRAPERDSELTRGAAGETTPRNGVSKRPRERSFSGMGPKSTWVGVVPYHEISSHEFHDRWDWLVC